MVKQESVFIATPCYGGLVYHTYMTSLIDTIVQLNKEGFGAKLATMGNESLITRARNQLCAEFLLSGCTHLMFIDADISWDAKDIIKLLKWDKDIIGGTYPMKEYCWDRTVQAAVDSRTKSDKFVPAMFRSKLMNYPVHYLDDETELKSNKGLVKVKRIATGFMLVKREAIIKMTKKYPELKLKQDSNRNPALEPFLWNFFDCMVKDGYYLSEDYAFCQRYLDIDPENHEIYTDISVDLSHTGTHTFDGHYGLSLLPKNTLE